MSPTNDPHRFPLNTADSANIKTLLPSSKETTIVSEWTINELRSFHSRDAQSSALDTPLLSCQSS